MGKAAATSFVEEASDTTRPMTNADLKKYEYIVHRVIRNKQLFDSSSSNAVEDYDDHLQNGLINMWLSWNKFNPDKGMKLTSYLEMVQKSRFGNFKNRTRKRTNQCPTVSMTDNNSWAICDSSGHSDLESNPYGGSSEMVKELSGGETALVSMIDFMTIRSKLKGFTQTLFDEYYVNNMTLQEIHQKYSAVKYHKIRRELERVQKIVETHCF